ncbi:MAG: hypothetical protein ACFFG0_12510 [Candidatus Thorarchaeota archaeon]
MIICNISLLKNKILILKYEFNISIQTSLPDVDYLDFQYDNVTAGFWNGTTSERIEIKVLVDNQIHILTIQVVITFLI